MNAGRESEVARLDAEVSSIPPVRSTSAILRHSILVEMFTRTVTALRGSLDDELFRGEAPAMLARLIESVPVDPAGEHGLEVEVVARIANLAGYATNDKRRPWGRRLSFNGVGCGDRI